VIIYYSIYDKLNFYILLKKKKKYRVTALGGPKPPCILLLDILFSENDRLNIRIEEGRKCMLGLDKLLLQIAHTPL
jgi:hypothetical protein